MPERSGWASALLCAALFAVLWPSALMKSSAPRVSTLVIYVYHRQDDSSSRNLNFFLQHGMRQDDGANYYIVIHQPSDRPDIAEDLSFISVAYLPRNALILRQKSDACGNWGTFGALLAKLDTTRYKYFVMVNSVARGPFIPAYVPASWPWHRLLTMQLIGDTHLVGPTIHCQSTDRADEGVRRANPYVQSQVIALDTVALDVLKRDGSVLKCYSNKGDAHWFSELGASKAVLEAGHNLASLMLRYRGVDWRDMANWDCNRKLNPLGELAVDGLSLTPTEIMFVPMTSMQLSGTHSLSIYANKYDYWMSPDARRSHKLAANAYADNPVRVKAPSMAAMRARGSRCFDHAFYLRSNRHLFDFQRLSPVDLWEHFVLVGQFVLEAGHRWTCDEEHTRRPSL